MSALGVDTRSDIYSLGVLLYELLTGSTPLTHKRIKEAAYGEVLRMIKEEEPPRPSTRLSDSGEALASISAQRHTEPAKLTKLVKGELDWIVMKALEKDRNRRYETASAFAQDVQRYLADEPVLACPPSAGYRFRKFARRHKAALVTALVVVAALLTGTAVATWQAVRATQAEAVAVVEKRRADKEAATAIGIAESLKQLVGSLDPDAAKGPDYTARQLLDDYADNLDTKLAGQPEVAADLHIILGRAYGCLAARDNAGKHLGLAVLLRRSVFGDEHEKYADALVEHARPDACDPSERPRCEVELRRALAIYRERGVGGEPVIRALWILSWLYRDCAYAGDAAKWDELEPIVKEAEAEARQFPGREFPRLASIYRHWASAEMAHGQYAKAERIARQALAMHLRLDGRDHVETAWGYYDLAHALRPQHHFAESLQADKQALAILRKHLPPGHPNIGAVLDAANYTLVFTLVEARKAHQWADGFPSVADLGEWEAVFREVLATTKPGKLDGRDPVLQAIDGLGRCSELYLHLADEWTVAGKSKEADESREKAVQLWEDLQTQVAGDPRLLPYVYAYGTLAMMKAGRPQQAEELCRKLLDQKTPETGQLCGDFTRLGLAAVGKAPEAGGLCNDVAWFLATAAVPAQQNPHLAVGLAKKAVEAKPLSSSYHTTLGIARYRARDYQQAISDLKKSVALGKGGSSLDFFFLAMAHWQLGDKDQARKLYDQALAWVDTNQPQNWEIRRFRAEAGELLGVKEKPD
jgi:tetratricopeptide (TPR) repeat protein